MWKRPAGSFTRVEKKEGRAYGLCRVKAKEYMGRGRKGSRTYACERYGKGYKEGRLRWSGL